MAKRSRIQVSGVTLGRLERMEIWLAGYQMPLVSLFTPDVEEQDESTPVFGHDGTIDTKVLPSGNLALTMYDHKDLTRDLLDVLSHVDPATTGMRGTVPSGTRSFEVVRLLKHQERSHYIGADFYGGWNVVLKPSIGGVKEAGTRTLSGRCDLPIEFRVDDPEVEGIVVFADVARMKVAADTHSTTGYLAGHSGPAAVTAVPAGYPELAGCFALVVEIQKRDPLTNVIIKSDRITIRPTTVTTLGQVTVTRSDLSGTKFVNPAEVTHCFVHALYYNPAVAGTWLLGDNIDQRGRWDTPGPAAPTGLAVSGVPTATQIPVSWVDNADDESGFEFQKSVDLGVTWTAAGTALPNTTTTAIGSLVTATSYQIRVRATHLTDNPSAWSNILTAVTA